MAKFLFIEFAAAFSVNDDETSRICSNEKFEQTQSDKMFCWELSSPDRKAKWKIEKVVGCWSEAISRTLQSRSINLISLRTFSKWISNQSSLNSFYKVPSLIKICIDASSQLPSCTEDFTFSSQKNFKHEKIASELSLETASAAS